MTRSKKNLKFASLFILLSIAWIILLFTESSQPPAKIMGEVSGLDKVAHFMAFGIFALLSCVAWFGVIGKQSRAVFIGPLLLASLLGIAEEAYQLTVPDRAASIEDMVADVFGAACALLLVRYSLLLNALKHWV